MSLCSHKSCRLKHQVWLPSTSHPGSEVKKHPWCIHCGLVKNISGDRPYKLGYWMNVLSNITYGFSLKQIQKRLIAKELSSHLCFNDTYGVTGSSQKELFKKIVKKYCSIDKHSIDPFIY